MTNTALSEIFGRSSSGLECHDRGKDSMRPRMIAMLAAGVLMIVCGPGCAVTQRIADAFTGNTPIKFARLMEDPTFPDHRRKGINALSARDFGRRKPYTTRYQQIAQNDPDYLVRAVAIRALNRSRDRSATPLFIKSLNDKSGLVRWEAAKALANVPDPDAAEPLARIVTNPADDNDVRIAAADALRHYHDPSVARALAHTLNGRNFGVAWQSRQSLKFLTGRDLKYDERAWIAFVDGPAKPLG
jgi:hypothetical protein